MYLPRDIVDIIIHHSIDVNLRHYMSEKVFPELLEVAPKYHMFRCDHCYEGHMCCINCARDYGYVSGPGYYYGKRYVCTSMITDEEVMTLNSWWNNRQVEVYFGDEVDYDSDALRLKYDVEKYNKGSVENLMFTRRLNGVSTYVIQFMIEMYECFEAKNKYIDSCNIRSFCMARGIVEHYEVIFSNWVECMNE